MRGISSEFNVLAGFFFSEDWGLEFSYLSAEGSENKTYKYGLMLHAQNIKFMINEIKYNYQADYTNEFVKFLTKIKEVSNSY